MTTKVGNAVVRNRLKRWVREFVRRRRAELPGGVDLIVVAKISAANAAHAAVDADLGELFRRLRGAR